MTSQSLSRKLTMLNLEGPETNPGHKPQTSTSIGLGGRNVLSSSTRSMKKFEPTQISSTFKRANQNDSEQSETNIIQQPHTRTQTTISRSGIYGGDGGGNKSNNSFLQVNKSVNFIPRGNNLSSTELLYNSGLNKSVFSKDDSTRADILYGENFYENPSEDNSEKARPLHQKLASIMEEKYWEAEKERRKLDPMYTFQPQNPFTRKRGSIIAEESIEFLQKKYIEDSIAASKKEPTVVFNPYSITTQDKLLELIEKDKLKQLKENDFQTRLDHDRAMKNASELMQFIGLNEAMDKPQSIANALQATAAAAAAQKIKADQVETDEDKKIAAAIKATADKPIQSIVDILKQMNSLTPDQQKIVIINSARGKNNVKSNFQEEEKDVNKRRINLIADGVKKQIEDDTKLAEAAAAEASNPVRQAMAAGIVNKEDLPSDDEDNNKKKGNVPNVINLKILKKSFHYPAGYKSTVIARAFTSIGKNYISKYLSQSTFNILDGQEEDGDQTVISGANYGQKVLLIEHNPVKIKPILKQGGKHRHAYYIHEDATQEEINQAKNISNLSPRQVRKQAMKTPAKVESKREKDYNLFGRSHPFELSVGVSKWENKMVQLGRRKVRFAKDYNLVQYELEQGYETIFKDPSYFDRTQVVHPSHQKEKLVQIGRQPSTFAGYDTEQANINSMEIHREKRGQKFFSVFDEQFIGKDPGESQFQNEWEKFAFFKQTYQAEFDRVDGFKRKYKGAQKIAKDLRGEDTYGQITAEEGERPWRPSDEPQTNPPDVLKEFQIEPNILVYSKNILDIDMNYKTKKDDVKEGRRQGIIGLVDSGTQASKMQNLAENKQIDDAVSPDLGQEISQINPELLNFRQRGGATALPLQAGLQVASGQGGGGANGGGGLSLADSIQKFQQMQQDGGSGFGESDEQTVQNARPLHGHTAIIPQQRKRELFDFMFENPAGLPFSNMKKIQRAVDDSQKVIVKLSEAEQAMFDMTPMIHANILTYKSFFRIKEAEAYEQELRLQKEKDRKPTQEELLKEKAEKELQKEKQQQQKNALLAAMNPINFQFTTKDLKTRTILDGLSDDVLKQTNQTHYIQYSKGVPMNEQNVQVEGGGGQQAKSTTAEPGKGVETKGGSAKSSGNKDTKNIIASPVVNQINIPMSVAGKTQTAATDTGSARRKGIGAGQGGSMPILKLEVIKEEEDVQNTGGVGDVVKKEVAAVPQGQFVDYGKLLEMKTISQLNELQGITSMSIITKTQNKINVAQSHANDYEYIGGVGSKVKEKQHDILLTTEDTQSSTDSSESTRSKMVRSSGVRTVVKNQYIADYGSHLNNAKLDYNTPKFYHNREAEQGLFYLSQHYRDYFEPARDVFAEKDGWDILDSFAKNPKNSYAAKPSVHNYGERQIVHDESDILTAFQGLQSMHDYNKLQKDVEKRNEQNLQRKIAFNQV